MSTDRTDVPPPPGPPTGVRKAPRGHPLIAWAVIVVASVGLFVLHLLFQPPAEVKEFDAFEIQARALVGWANVAPMAPVLYEQATEFNRGPAGQRLRFVVLVGELRGPDEALTQLDDLKQQMNKGEVEGTNKDSQETADILGRLYRDYTYGKALPGLGASMAGYLGLAGTTSRGFRTSSRKSQRRPVGPQRPGGPAPEIAAAAPLVRRSGAQSAGRAGPHGAGGGDRAGSAAGGRRDGRRLPRSRRRSDRVRPADSVLRSVAADAQPLYGWIAVRRRLCRNVRSVDGAFRRPDPGRPFSPEIPAELLAG